MSNRCIGGIRLLFNHPLSQAASGYVIGRIISLTEKALFQDSLREMSKECIKKAIDNLSNEYPVSRVIDSRTFWDNFSYELLESFEGQEINLIELKAIFIKTLQPYNLQQDLERIYDSFLRFLDFEITQHDQLYRLITLQNFNKLSQVITSRLKSDVTNFDSEITEEQLAFYLADIQQWALKEIVDGGISRIFDNLTSKEIECRRFTLESLVQSEKNYIILGEPGCGKTFTLKQIIIEISTFNSCREACKIPVYIGIASFGTAFSSIVDAMRITLSRKIKDISVEKCKDLLSSGDVVLLIDGLDEVRSDFFEQCIYQIRELLKTYNKTKFVISSRDNVYYNEFEGYVEKALLLPLAEHRVKEILKSTININVDNVSNDFIQLFGNPLLLNIGIQVIRENAGKVPVNRSLLFREFVEYLIIKWEREKGIKRTKSINYIETIQFLSYLAYHTFDKVNYTIEEIYFYVSRIFPSKDADDVYSYLMHLGVLDLNLDGRVTFLHRTFKEYFAAKYLVFELEEQFDDLIISTLVSKKHWIGVMQFASGLFSNWECLDKYLQALFENNIKVYIECLKQKNDFKDELLLLSEEEYTKMYLELLLNTYEQTINHYFAQIKHQFYPYYGFIDSLNDYKLGVRGFICDDRESLGFMFIMVKLDEEKVAIKSLTDVEKEYHKVSYTSIRSYVNLRLSDRMGDSARQVALDQIRSELDKIIKYERLNESNVILCEKVHSLLKKLRKDSILKTTIDIIAWTESIYLKCQNDLIKQGLEPDESIGSYCINDVNIFELMELARMLQDRGIVNYPKYLLPEHDKLMAGGRWVWDFYTKEQLVKRVFFFFKYKQESYIEMVELNFNSLKQFMPDFLNYPYKYYVTLYFPPKKPSDYRVEPLLRYYYMPIKLGNDVAPKVEVVDKEPEQTKLLEKYRHIPNFRVTGTLISSILQARRKFSSLVLTEAVYEQLKDNLKKIGFIA